MKQASFREVSMSNSGLDSTKEVKPSELATNSQADLSSSSLDLLRDHGQVLKPKFSPHTAGDPSIYPDPSLTPGAIFPDVTAAEVCTPGYSKSVRNVSQQTKNEVFKEYGITNPQPGEYEIDHFISLELGGTNDISNLWPESYKMANGAHEKDKVENYLHKQVCNGNMTLQEAQDAIRTDWYAVYLQMQKGKN